MAILGLRIDGVGKFFSLSLNSLVLGFCAVMLSFIFALPSAYIFTLNSGFIKKLITFMLLLLAILPPFFLSLLLSNLFFTMDMENGFFALMLAHAIPIFPYTFILMVLGFSFVPKEATSMAKLYCKSQILGFLRFYFPFMKSVFLIAFLLGLSVSMSQYILTLMLTKPSFSTLILGIVPYLQSGDMKSAATYGLVFLINTPIAFFAIYKLKAGQNVIS